MADWPQRRAARRARQQGYPVAGVELRIVDDDGVEHAVGRASMGELQVRGPWVMQSYYDNPEAADALHRRRLVPHGRRRHDRSRGLHPDHRPHQGPDQVRRRVDLSRRRREPDHGPPQGARGRGHRRAPPEVGGASARVRRARSRASRRSTRPRSSSTCGRQLAKWALPDEVVLIETVPKTSVGKFDKKVLRDRFKGWRPPDAPRESTDGADGPAR